MLKQNIKISVNAENFTIMAPCFLTFFVHLRASKAFTRSKFENDDKKNTRVQNYSNNIMIVII